MNTATIDRALGLAVEHLGGRRWRVASYSGATPHIVHGAADTPLDEWTCDCRASAGRRGVRCSHKLAVALERGIDVTMANDILSSPPSGVSVAGASVPATGRRGDHDTGGAMNGITIDGTRLAWVGSVTDRATAVQVHGGIEGGAKVMLDIPDDGQTAQIVAALVAMRRMPLRITIEPA